MGDCEGAEEWRELGIVLRKWFAGRRGRVVKARGGVRSVSEEDAVTLWSYEIFEGF